MFGSVPNCTVLVQKADATLSSVATTEAQQESSAILHEDNSGNPLDGSTCSVVSYGSGFLPPLEPLKSYRRVSETSIPFTLESSSASSSGVARHGPTRAWPGLDFPGPYPVA